MQMFDWHPEPTETTGRLVSEADLDTMAVLLRELRDVTLSRATFTAIDDLLSRIVGEAPSSSLVRADALET